MSDPTVKVPEVVYKAQRVARTVFAFLAVAVPLVNGLAAATIDYLRNQEHVEVYPWVWLVLNGTVAFTAVLIGLFNRWMQTPGFNLLLTKIGLGTVPKPVAVAEARAEARGDEGPIPDPRVVG